jgi:hypothetical protein
VASALGARRETRKRLGQLLLEDVVTIDLASGRRSSADSISPRPFDSAATAIDELARRYGAVPVLSRRQHLWSR